MFICESCNEQFDQTPKGKQEWLLHRASHKDSQGKIPEIATGEKIKSMSAQEIKQQQAKEQKSRKPKKATLEYRWSGECPNCFGMLDSIDIEAGQPAGKMITVAFCGSCKNEVAHRQVDKL